MRTTLPRRFGRSAATGGPDAPAQLHIDRALPTYDAVSRRHVVVDASPEATYEAALAADLTRLGPVVGLLGALRELPTRAAAWLRGTTVPEATSLTLGDLPTRGTWVRLADVAGEEFVFGAVGTVWRPDIEWVKLTSEEFRGFDRPGYAKIVAGLSFVPYGEERTLVTYEARTAGTDAVSAWKFELYWRLVGPFVGYILGRVLRRVGRDAEPSR
jgi:hypothetical protein